MSNPGFDSEKIKPKANQKFGPWKDAVWCTCLAFLVPGLVYLTVISFSAFSPFETAFRDFEFTDIYYSSTPNENNVPHDIDVLGGEADEWHGDDIVEENDTLNENTVRYGETPESSKHHIVLINIQQEGRARIAQMIEQIMRQQPRVLALDIRFISRKDSVGDAALRTALLNHPQIITSYSIDHDTDTLIGNDPYFEQRMKNAGFINFYTDNGLTVIRDYLGEKVIGGKDTLYSFGYKVAAAYLAQTDKTRKISYSYKDKFPIHYRGNVHKFTHFDHTFLDQNDSIPVLKDAIVLLGYLGTPGREAFDIEDKHFTPVNPFFTGKSTPDMYGVVIHANAIDMLLNDTPLIRVHKVWILVIAFLLSVLITRLALEIKKKTWALNDLLVKFIQFSMPILLVYLGLILINVGIMISVKFILILVLMSVSMIETHQGIKRWWSKKKEKSL